MTARILVVDDNPLNLKLLAAKLARDYYIVSMAENGAQALHKIRNDKPDIVLLDVMMPEMDGFEVCRQVKSDPETEHVPIVMVTALADVADRVKGLKAGADDFLTKPINDTALMARVRSLLRFKMIMDEWRLREATSNQLVGAVPGEEADLAAYAGGNVLVLEDNAAERQLITETLATVSVRVTFAGTIDEAIATAGAGSFDLVFASLDLSAEDGLMICPQLRTHEATRQIPILLIGNEAEMPRIAKGLDLGANDYLVRPLDTNEILARTRTQLRHKRYYDRLRKNYEDSLALSLVDPLTGAFNRRYLEAHLPKMMARSKSSFKPLSTLMIDIDHFKKVNDTYGHSVGDNVLRSVAGSIINSLRPSDLVVRMGGEEFAAIMPETNLPSALAIAERLRERIASLAIQNREETFNVTVSIGGACIYEGNESVEEILKRADAALYQAKETGRNKVVGDNT
ncbi:MAG TPA: PleD family two-component system response regulator [Alphaproteobacteria bacterium]|nr:PleD family two-component system response regulator [Alphaproteobacteria bacterium]